MKKEKGYLSIYKIPVLKNCPPAQILEVAREMVNNGLIRWVDEKKGLAEITGLGFTVQEVRRGDRNN